MSTITLAVLQFVTMWLSVFFWGWNDFNEMMMFALFENVFLISLALKAPLWSFSLTSRFLKCSYLFSCSCGAWVNTLSRRSEDRHIPQIVFTHPMVICTYNNKQESVLLLKPRCCFCWPTEKSQLQVWEASSSGLKTDMTDTTGAAVCRGKKNTHTHTGLCGEEEKEI